MPDICVEQRLLDLAAREEMVRTDVIAIMLDEWRASNPGYTPLAQRAYLSADLMVNIVAGRIGLIDRLTAGKILAALEEPMRPEIARAYKRWARSKKIDTSSIEVIR